MNQIKKLRDHAKTLIKTAKNQNTAKAKASLLLASKCIRKAEYLANYKNATK